MMPIWRRGSSGSSLMGTRKLKLPTSSKSLCSLYPVGPLTQWRVEVWETSWNQVDRKKTTSLADRDIFIASKRNSRLTARQILSQISTPNNPKISINTVKRRLASSGLNGIVGVRKALISKKNKTDCKVWTKKHKVWFCAQWCRILWSNESKFNSFGSDGKQWARRPVGARNDPKYQIPAIKHGGKSITVWGCFSISGVGPLDRIDGRMNVQIYADILENNMFSFARRNMPAGWIYQPTNGPRHRSTFLQKLFKVKKWRFCLGFRKAQT